MQLPGILGKITSSGNQKNEPFIALEITPEIVKAAIWIHKESVVELLGVAQKEYAGDWETVIQTTDDVIAEASGNLPENENVQRVIFGLPNFWTKENKIESRHLENLKRLCNSLDLKPLGFVTIPEAIANYFQKHEGSPLTALLIGIGKSSLTVSLVRVGKIDKVITKPKTEELTEDINRAFSEFTNVEVLPSRILLFDSDSDLENMKQELIAFPWQAKSSFLHFPKIEILETGTDIKAVALAGGMELSQTLDIRLAEENQIKDKQEEKQPIQEESETLGFVKDKDILEEIFKPSKEEPPGKIEITKEQQEEKAVQKPGGKFSVTLPKISIPKPKFILPTVPNLAGKSKILILGAVLTATVLGISIFIFYWYSPSATVNLLVDPKTLEKDEEVIGNPKAIDVDESKKIIPITITEISESGVKTATATGKKTIGDKAHGEITVYNKTNNEKSFKDGDVLVASNNLKFSLDDDATIASQSVSKIGTTFGIAKVKVTAMQIGPEGNLSANTDFSFKEYPQTSYAASNEAGFTGGSAREITVISKDDQNKLVESLLGELSQKIKEESSGKVPSGAIAIEQNSEPKIVRKIFDKEEGTQSQNVTLTLEIQSAIMNYKISDLEKISTEQFAANVPEGYEFKPSDILVQSQVKETKKDGTIIFNAHFKSRLLPKIDADSVKKNIVGKDLKVVETYFRQLPNIAGFEIVLKPQPPFGIRTLPRNSNNITIAVSFRK